MMRIVCLRLLGAVIVFLMPVAADAQPAGLDAACAGVYARYAATPGPKAFAAGKSGRCGWQRQTADFATPAAIRAQAVRQCTDNGGTGCRVVAQSN